MKYNLLIVHPFTPYEPGRFLEDALHNSGYRYTLYDHGVDFGLVNQQLYDAVLFIESPWKTPDPVVNIQKVRIPKLYWSVHGESRINFNVAKAHEYRADCVLLANSFHLTPHYGGIPCYPLPMAVDLKYFGFNRPLHERKYDISFIGSFKPPIYYGERNRLLDLIRNNFPGLRLYFKDGHYLEQMGQIYGNSKIVFNWNYMNILTVRPFEAMAGGAMLLTNHAHGIEMLGNNRVQYVIYRNDQDLINKINFYFARPDKLHKVATSGYQTVTSAHTYIHRVRELQRILNQFVK